MAIRGDGTQRGSGTFATGGVQVNPVQIIAGFLADMAKRVLSNSLRKVAADSSKETPRSSSFIAGNSSAARAGNTKDEASGPQLQVGGAILLLKLDHGPVGQTPHDLIKRMRCHRRGAGLGDLGRLARDTSVRSMSVAVSSSSPPCASSRTFDRIGIVVRRSTTLWT